MATRTDRTPRTRARTTVFLKVLRDTCDVSEAARQAGIGRSTVYEWRDEDPEFAAAWLAAEDEATDALEAEARRRAVEGWDEPVFYEGEVCGHKRKYSDRMLEILLKGHRPERFVERRQVEHSGPGGGPITIVDLIAELDAEEDEADRIEAEDEDGRGGGD